MAKNLKKGEKVTVTREIHTGKDTAAYKAGLTRIQQGQVGEVVGQAEGPATFVKLTDKSNFLCGHHNGNNRLIRKDNFQND